jgi:hypothetical protein
MPNERIDRLSKRFKQHGVGRPSAKTRSRERHSFYVDSALIAQLDKAYKDMNHELYPQSVSKSAFLEAFIEYGLAHVSDVKGSLTAPGEEEGGTPSPH